MTDPPGGVLWPVCANPVADDDGAVELRPLSTKESSWSPPHRAVRPAELLPQRRFRTRPSSVLLRQGWRSPCHGWRSASSSCGCSWTSSSVSATPHRRTRRGSTGLADHWVPVHRGGRTVRIPLSLDRRNMVGQHTVHAGPVHDRRRADPGRRHEITMFAGPLLPVMMWGAT